MKGTELSQHLSYLVKELLNEPSRKAHLSLEEIIKQTVWYRKQSWYEMSTWSANSRGTVTSCISYKGRVLYLTGSRYFLEKARTEKTDFDFFTAYDEELINHLKEQGYTEPNINGQIYKDKDCLLVLRKQETKDFPQIDIQFVQHVGHRAVARNLLDTLGYDFWSTVDKAIACKLWDIALTMAMLPSPFGSMESFHPLNTRDDD